jgi:diaminopimelate epimerase
MQRQFIKMHGLGNDFVVIDARAEPVSISGPRARAIADRKTGIGCDQLIIIEPSDDADAMMRIWNADGAEVESCGNAARCVASLLGGKRRIATLGGIMETNATDTMVSVAFPAPHFDWDAIPLAYPMDTSMMPVGWDQLSRPMAVNVGNPHVIFFVDDANAVPLDTLGPLIEHDPLFPNRINVNVANITGPASLTLRVWERGVGLTRACGTGACATAVAAIRSRRVTGPVAVSLPGGTLEIDWQVDGDIIMRGPATEVYRGEADWSQFG